ncbi:MAG: hypothetical protein C4547_12490 [Phycisphaerales bacterium]|nr:MAG: hypothetical protein C4547_12490 [Phycisphaerales bacterium]
MYRWRCLVAPVVGMALCGSGRADVQITLEAKVGSEPLAGPVERDTEVTIDVLLSVTADDDPLEEVRSLQFDFRSTDDAIEVTGFEWLLGDLGFPANYFEEDQPPIVRANHIGVGNLLALTQTPARVGRVTVIARESGTFDLSGGDVADEDNVDEGLRLVAGVAAPHEFSIFAGDASADTVDVEVDGSSGGNENENGGGPSGNDNSGPPPDRNVGPRAQFTFCGAAALAPALLGLGALSAVRLTRRRCRTGG